MDLTIILIEQGNRCTELHISGNIYLPAVFNTHYNETKDAYIFSCDDKGSPYRLAKLMCNYGYYVNFERRQAGYDTYRNPVWLRVMYAQYGSYSKIAKVTGIPDYTLRNWAHKLSVHVYPRRKDLEKGHATYRCRNWLLSMLELHGSYRKIAQATGVSTTTLSEWGRRHSITSRAHKAISGEMLAKIIAWGGGNPPKLPRQAIAERLGISRSTVSAVLKHYKCST
ncbi:MAG: helix-turn-helix domain-containing protein [Deinococcota bacterium]